jgi:lysophospholipase L1-like esterase
VRRRRSGRAAVALSSAAVALVAAHAGAGGTASVDSARAAGHFGVAATDERVRAAAYRIAFFGDSLSVGYGASDPHHGYVGRVSRWLRTRGKRVVATVNAKGGVTVGYWAYAPMPTQLDAAVVELGTNDVRLGTPSSQFRREYRTLTGRIAGATPNAQLLCLSVWPRRGGARVESAINAAIRAACPGTYVDITRLQHRAHVRSSDGFHPNDAGYLLIARAVEKRLNAG